MASMDEHARRRRVTYSQLEALWEILNSHRELAVGYNKTTHAREQSRRMWEMVAETLNALDGAVKDARGWSNYWIDYKAKLKRRVVAVRNSGNRTGGGPSDVLPLIDIEKKFLAVLGENFGIGLPNIQVPLFPDVPQPSVTHIEVVQLPSPPIIQQDYHPYPNHEPQPSPEPQPSLEPQSQPPPEVSQSLPEVSQPPPEVSQPPPEAAALHRRRRRRHREPQLTQEEARIALVEHSRETLELARQNTRIWEQMLSLLRVLVQSSGRPEPGHESAPRS